MTDEQARKLYCRAFPDSPQAAEGYADEDDWKAIAEEMRQVVEAKTLDDAMEVIAWWWWDSDEVHRKATQRVRRMAKRLS